MAGGDPTTLERVRPVLNAIADPERIYHCGPVGAGMVTKLCNNMVDLISLSVWAEALTVGLKAGVPLETLSEVMGNGSLRRLGRSIAFVRCSMVTSIRPASRS